MRVLKLGEKTDGLHYALDALEEWLKSRTFEDDPAGDLERHALYMRDKVVEEYALASESARAAHLAAQEGPPEPGGPSPASEEWEHLARLIMRSDAFNNARTILEGIPQERFGAHHDKWATIAALIAAHDEAAGECERYKRGLGLRD